MTAFEEALYAAACADDQLVAMLSAINDGTVRPAFFEKLPPDDLSPVWDGNPIYPRVVYEVTRQGDWTRTITGTLMFTVLCHFQDVAQPQDIADRLHDLFHGAGFHPSNEPVIFSQFRTSQLFDLGGTTVSRGDQILGISCAYELTGFPTLSTVAPSPVDALNAWATTTYPNQVQVDPAVYAPSNTDPALYWRPTVETAEFPNRGTLDRLVAWYRVTCRGTILAPDTATRLRMSEQITRDLGLAREIALGDGSPFEFTRVTFDSSATATVGQIAVDGWIAALLPDPDLDDEIITDVTLNLKTDPSVNAFTVAEES